MGLGHPSLDGGEALLQYFSTTACVIQLEQELGIVSKSVAKQVLPIEVQKIEIELCGGKQRILGNAPPAYILQRREGSHTNLLSPCYEVVVGGSAGFCMAWGVWGGTLQRLGTQEGGGEKKVLYKIFF